MNNLASLSHRTDSELQEFSRAFPAWLETERAALEASKPTARAGTPELLAKHAAIKSIAPPKMSEMDAGQDLFIQSMW